MENDRTALKLPIWLWPNVLSLDAPLVALCWMWMLSKALRVAYILPQVWWVLPLAVWCVYVMDRLVDAWRRPELRASTPRHQFHWRWRWPLLLGVIVAAVTSGYQAMYVLPRSVFSAGLAVVVLCMLYFLLVLFRGSRVPYVKNLFAGMIFALGVGIPVNVANSSLLITDLNEVYYALRNTGLGDAFWNLADMVVRTLVLVFVYCKEVLFFGLLCMMNIMAIDLWEEAACERDEVAAYHHEATLTLGLIMVAGGALLFAATRADEFNKPYFYAIMVSAALLQVLNHYRERFSMNSLRVLADVALLVPVPIFLFG